MCLPENEVQMWHARLWSKDSSWVHILDTSKALLDAVPDLGLHFHDGHVFSICDSDPNTSVAQGALKTATRSVCVSILGDVRIKAHLAITLFNVLSKFLYSRLMKFIRHEILHSIKCIWLSEGIAEFSGVLLVPVVGDLVLRSGRRCIALWGEVHVCSPDFVW